MAYDVNKVINIALAEVGYLEKKSNSNLDSKTANAGYKNYTKYGRDMHKLYPSVMDFPAAWCDCFVDWCFYKAYGVCNAKGLLGGNFNDYTVASAQLYKNKDAWHASNPKVGDQIFFKNSSRICHTGLVYKVTSTTVYTIEGNTSGASGVIANGGGVCKKSYPLSYSRIAGYGRPNYGTKSNTSTSTTTSKTPTSKIDTVKEVQTMKKVIDTSSYNGEVNFKFAKSQGVDGAILKIIRKDLGYDKQFLNSQKNCETNKLPWGVYNYSYATTVSKAKSDMKLICDILDKLSSKKYFKLGVWFDIEDDVQEKLNKTEIANIINAAQSVVESRGYKFGVYTGLAYYNAHMDAKKILCKNWWIARYYNGYNEMNFSTDPNEKYKPLTNCFAWQYTSSGTFNPKICSGNNGHVDISVQYQEFTTNKVTSEPNISTSYYSKYTGSSTKIDEVFKSIGVTSDYYGSVTKRKPIASANGISNYTGTSTQNLNLISLAKKGKLKKPSSTTVSSSYYNKYTGKSLKIDEVFKAIGVPEKYRGSKTKRKPVAVKNGYSNYTGTSTQNLKLIALAQKGALKKV